MEYIRVTKENIEKEHICCAISSNKDIQVISKKNWLKERFDDGLVFLNEKTAEIFSNLTGGRYEKVMVDKEYAIQAKPKAGGYHEWKYLSSGTTDQAYLSLRLAMTELITDNGERLPLMLDDVLLQYDAERAENALEYLKKYAQNAQILFFTCRNMQDEDIINLRNIIE